MGRLAINGGTSIRTKPFPSWPQFDDREADALLAALHSGKWNAAFGEKVSEFESRFAAAHHCQFGTAVSSGTAALQVALRAVGVHPGDEVIVPPYTFMATATAVLEVNGVPVFADIEPGTYNLDPAAVEAAITDRARAILAVHIAGRPANMTALRAIADKHDIALLEDACQAHGASWEGRRVGSLSLCGCFSFQASKNINAGEGGIIVSNHEEVNEPAWSWANCGRTRGGAWYGFSLPGTNFRMTEFQGAILLTQLDRMEEWVRTRQANGDYLAGELDNIDGISAMEADERVTENAYHLFMFRYDASGFAGAPRQSFLEALQAEGIPCSPGYNPLYRETYFESVSEWFPAVAAAGVDYCKVECPVTERVCAEEAVWLKQTMLLGSREDMDDIVAAVRKIHDHADELVG